MNNNDKDNDRKTNTIKAVLRIISKKILNKCVKENIQSMIDKKVYRKV